MCLPVVTLVTLTVGLAPDDRQSPILNLRMKNGTAGPARYDIMTNQTACMDGYSHAWEDLCAKDGKTCVAVAIFFLILLVLFFY